MHCSFCGKQVHILKFGVCLECSRLGVPLCPEHQRTLAKYADNMRFMLDLVCRMVDDRVDEQSRRDAASDLLDRDDLFKNLSEVREVFRSIANERTDKGGK